MPELAYSTSKALFHTDKIQALQQNKMIIPTEIQIDPEAWCNDNCRFCSYRIDEGYNNIMTKKLLKSEPGQTENKPIGKPSEESRIPKNILLDIPRQMKKTGIPAIEVTGGGEPTLHPNINEFLELIGKHELDLGLVTNGSRLNDKLIDIISEYALWCRISVDSSNPLTHQAIHRTPNKDFERRLANIKQLIKVRNEKGRQPNENNEGLTIGISFIITPDNFHDIENSAKLFSEIGVNHIRFSWQYDKQGTAGLFPEQIEYIAGLIPRLQEKYDREDFKIFNEKNRISLYTKPNEFKQCNFQKFVVNIGADSKFYPCCIMKYHPNFAYGDLRNNTIKEIVTSMNTKEFMDNLDPSRCFPCWLRERNASINSGVYPPRHKNFI